LSAASDPKKPAGGLSPAGILLSLPVLLTAWHLAVFVFFLTAWKHGDLFVFVAGTYVVLVLPALFAWGIYRASVAFAPSGNPWLRWAPWLLLLAAVLAAVLSPPRVHGTLYLLGLYLGLPILAAWIAYRVTAALDPQRHSWLRWVRAFAPWLLVWTCLLLAIGSDGGKFRGAGYVFTVLDLAPPLAIWAVLALLKKRQAGAGA
jgi:hypothetical protein